MQRFLRRRSLSVTDFHELRFLKSLHQSIYSKNVVQFWNLRWLWTRENCPHAAFDKNGYFDRDALQLVWKFNSPRTLFQTTISASTWRKELQSPYLHRGRWRQRSYQAVNGLRNVRQIPRRNLTRFGSRTSASRLERYAGHACRPSEVLD